MAGHTELEERTDTLMERLRARAGDIGERTGRGGRKAHPEGAAQQVLDAAALLQLRRSEVASRLTAGKRTGAELVAVGREINPYLFRVGEGWTDLLAVHPGHTNESVRRQLPLNRVFLETKPDRHVVSVYDYDGTETAARQVLANETVGNYFFSFAPVQMKIIDRRSVILEGPLVDGERSIMDVAGSACLDAAWRYWEAVMACAIPASQTERRQRRLTARQEQIFALLGRDVGDDAIAATLGISVRTVRTEIATVLDLLGVRSRFAAGLQLGLESGEH